MKGVDGSIGKPLRWNPKLFYLIICLHKQEKKQEDILVEASISFRQLEGKWFKGKDNNSQGRRPSGYRIGGGGGYAWNGLIVVSREYGKT